MTRQILLSVVAGIICGYFFMPETAFGIEVSPVLSKAVSAGLCLMLLLVGIDMGYEGTIVSSMRQVGLRVLLIPFTSAAGALVMAFAASLVLPIAAGEALAVASGFGWYTLAPAIIMEKSEYIGTVSFMHNVMRELLGIVFIPMVAKKMGYVECASLPGAAAMDTCLPIVERATSSDTVVYSFVTGVILSILVPLLVPVFISL